MKVACLALLIIFSPEIYAQQKQALSTAEQLFNSTTKIQAFRDTVIDNKKVRISSVGTGFFLTFYVDMDTIPVIVTNAHVVNKYDRGTIKFNSSANGLPEYGKIITINFKNFNELWLYHPSEDLAVLPLAPVYNNKIKSNLQSFTVNFPETLIPSEQIFESFDAIEDVLMIGYPKGFGDSVNNLPVIRKGSTATPVYLNYNGNPQFLIDIPIFPGSSGSPIILYDNQHVDKRGNLVIIRRAFFLGVVVESQNYLAKGIVNEDKRVPNSKYLTTLTDLPFNIGIVIKSYELLQFKSILKRLESDANYGELYMRSIE
ncbi:MAG TPA: serine protease [Puia sp.]|nr:serine protease [Puia sp.]